jgi:hypothetical protein
LYITAPDREQLPETGPHFLLALHASLRKSDGAVSLEGNVEASFILPLGQGDMPGPTTCLPRTGSQLPAQEGVGLPINDIPYIGRIANVRIGDCDYVPARA